MDTLHYGKFRRNTESVQINSYGTGLSTNIRKIPGILSADLSMDKKYQSDGVEGLVDRRGKGKTESEMSELELSNMS